MGIASTHMCIPTRGVCLSRFWAGTVMSVLFTVAFDIYLVYYGFDELGTEYRAVIMTIDAL
jgi:hypothetical protein